MSTVNFTIESIGEVSIVGFSKARMDITLDMDETQMKEALGEFLANVSEKVWRAWVDELASDYLDEIREESVKLGREQAEAERGDE